MGKIQHVNVGSQSRSFAAPPIEARQAAQYIAEMILELRNIAKSANFKALQGLLEVSYYEAFSAAHPPAIPPGEEDYLEDLGGDARQAQAQV